MPPTARIDMGKSSNAISVGIHVCGPVLEESGKLCNDLLGKSWRSAVERRQGQNKARETTT